MAGRDYQLVEGAINIAFVVYLSHFSGSVKTFASQQEICAV